MCQFSKMLLAINKVCKTAARKQICKQKHKHYVKSVLNTFRPPKIKEAINKVHLVPQRALDCGPGLGGLSQVYGPHHKQSC